MTKEEKTLLTKVLCEQLPYNVKVHCKWFMYQEETPTEDIGVLVQISDKKALVKRQNQTTSFYLNSCGCSILPYLRPLPSMTESEARGIAKLYHISDSELLDVKVTVDGIGITLDDNFCSYEKEFIRFDEIVASVEIFDYLNAKHFDIRGLLPNGLAIAAVGENNPYKEKGGEE